MVCASLSLSLSVSLCLYLTHSLCLSLTLSLSHTLSVSVSLCLSSLPLHCVSLSLTTSFDLSVCIALLLPFDGTGTVSRFAYLSPRPIHSHARCPLLPTRAAPPAPRRVPAPPPQFSSGSSSNSGGSGGSPGSCGLVPQWAIVNSARPPAAGQQPHAQAMHAGASVPGAPFRLVDQPVDRITIRPLLRDQSVRGAAEQSAVVPPPPPPPPRVPLVRRLTEVCVPACIGVALLARCEHHSQFVVPFSLS